MIRVPGGSRGTIDTVEGVVRGIALNEDNFCYKKEVLDNLNQFIGREIDLGR